MDVIGRAAELGRLSAWLQSGTPSHPAPKEVRTVLVIEGEPGIGKTTLWAEGVRQARMEGRNVLLCRPRPSDAGLPNVGLTDLLRSVPEEAFETLPLPQRRPLEVATLRRDAGDGDLEPRAVGTALAALLANLGNRGSLLLAVDDAQWLDPASARALGFAMHRQDGRDVRLLAALRIDSATTRPSTEDLDLDALEPAQRAGLVRVHPDGRVDFTHPLYGSALYSSLPEATRRKLHGRLAAREASLEERARHIALASSGPDEASAEVLDRAAAAAGARGAPEMAVELKELALRLTPTSDSKAVVRREIELASRRYFAV